MKEKGFILTAGCLDSGGRCELHLYGSGTCGPFLLVFSPHKPLFFIERSCPEDFTRGIERKPLELRSFGGNPADGLYFKTMNEYFSEKRRLAELGVRLFESDIRAEDRFLMERFINCGLAVEGTPLRRGGMNIFRNPVIRTRRIQAGAHSPLDRSRDRHRREHIFGRVPPERRKGKAACADEGKQ